MELLSRIAFLDTNVYEGKNFQFLTHSLGSLKELVESGEVRLLINSVTINEVRGHIREKCVAAAAEVKAITKKAMILRSMPDIAAYGVFEPLDAADLEKVLVDNFESFLNNKNVEYFSVDNVLPSRVFDSYFSVKAPFALGEKRKEFADAFVLEALKDFADERGHYVHVISSDRDMHRYAAENPRLLCDHTLDEFISAVNHAVSVSPSAFADEVYSKFYDSVMEAVVFSFKSVEFLDESSMWVGSIESKKINSIRILGKSLISVVEEGCDFSLDVEVDVEIVRRAPDFGRSAFDTQDGVFQSIAYTLIKNRFVERVPVALGFEYESKLMSTVSMDSLSMPAYVRLENMTQYARYDLDADGGIIMNSHDS
ncbi:PIN domain-containing protein [Pseudomonas fluorescens]